MAELLSTNGNLISTDELSGNTKVSFVAATGITEGYAVRLGEDGKIYPMDSVGKENQPIIGIAQTSGATNGSVDVVIEGGLSTVTSGLTPSYNYYTATNGSISLTGETYIGTAVSSSTLQVWFGNPNGVVIPSLSVIDNTIADPANITVPGRYIVPVSGLTGSFVGNANDYADYNGVSFTFILPTNNDKAVITTGPNAGNTYLFTSGSTSGWTISSQSTTLSTSNWSSGVAYKQFDMVIYQSGLYQANGNIPANTAFVIGTTGATWKQIGVNGQAEYNSIYPSNGLATSSTSLVNLPGSTLTLPSAGVYRVQYNMYVSGPNDGSSVIFIVANSDSTYNFSYGSGVKVAGSTNASVANQEIIISVNSPITLNLKWRINGSGTATILNDTTSNSVFSYEKIAGFLPATSSLPQYISVVKIDDQSTVGTATDITWGTVESSNGLTLSSNSVTLTGGKIYQITAAFSVNTFSNSAAGYSIVSLYNSSNTKLSPVAAALVTPAATNETNSPVVNLIYSPSTDTTVKFRVADASGTVLYRGGGFTSFTITEIK